MRRKIGMDIYRTFSEVVFWEEGKPRHGDRVDRPSAKAETYESTITTHGNPECRLDLVHLPDCTERRSVSALVWRDADPCNP